MAYWKIIFYVGNDFETSEVIITDDEYKNIQEMLSSGVDFIILKDRPTIKRSSVLSIIPADFEVSEYEKTGVKIDRILEKNSLKLPSKKGNFGSIRDYLKSPECQKWKELFFKSCKENKVVDNFI